MNSSKPWFVAALVALASAGAGVVLGWSLHGAPDSVLPAASLPEPQARPGVSREEFELAQQALLSRLDRIAAQRFANSGAAPAGSDGAVIELGHRIDELESRVALLAPKPHGAARTPTWTPPHGPGSGSLDAIAERVRNWGLKMALDQETPPLESQLLAEHDLWTFDDLVHAYGTPVRWERQGNGWNLCFGQVSIEHWDRPLAVQFDIRDGYVDEVHIRPNPE